MTEFGRSPLLSVEELGQLGYQAVLFPLTPFRAAMRAAEQTLIALRERGTQRDLLERLQSRAELYDLLGYDDWEARDRSYFSQGPAPPASD
jgi:methylisocitrate lyase